MCAWVFPDTTTTNEDSEDGEETRYIEDFKDSDDSEVSEDMDDSDASEVSDDIEDSEEGGHWLIPVLTGQWGVQ